MIIISKETDEITDYILNTINRGVSLGKIPGAFSNKYKTKVICICSARESMLIKNFVAKIDHDAFINLVPVISAWGKGYGFDNLELD